MKLRLVVLLLIAGVMDLAAKAEKVKRVVDASEFKSCVAKAEKDAKAKLKRAKKLYSLEKQNIKDSCSCQCS